MDHMSDGANYMAAAGHKSPAERVGAEGIDVSTEFEVYGAKCWYFEAKERRVQGAKHNEMPGRRGIWVGRSQTISGGHRVIPIEWSKKKQEWTLLPTIERSYVVVDWPKPLFREIFCAIWVVVRSAKEMRNLGCAPRFGLGST